MAKKKKKKKKKTCILKSIPRFEEKMCCLFVTQRRSHIRSKNQQSCAPLVKNKAGWITDAPGQI